MYGGAVPALSELIANAWDADSTRVDITVPFGVTLNDPTQSITVADNGRGMSWEDVRDQYLVIGRDRRAVGGSKTLGGRNVLGRKGIGKLAGFGIARVVEVRTVHNDWLTHFVMNFDDMTRAGSSKHVERYLPEILADKRLREQNNTRIVMRRLLLSRRINEEEFRESMARRFAILSNQFKVFVNGKPLSPQQTKLQLRFPAQGMFEENLPDFGSIRYWIGFTEKPIKQVDGRGIAVMVRGKLAQVPFFFDIRGGMSAQHALEYMTGEIHADELDDAEDYIGTNRQEIVWSEPLPSVLLGFGDKLVREYASIWRKERKELDTTHNLAILYDQSNALESRLGNLEQREASAARLLIDRVAGVPSLAEDPETLVGIGDAILSVYERQASKTLIEDVAEARSSVALLRLLEEFRVFDSGRLKELTKGRYALLASLRKMAQEQLRGLDLYALVRDNLWLFSGPMTVMAENAEATSEIELLRSQLGHSSLSKLAFVGAQHATRLRVIAVDRSANPAGAIVEKLAEFYPQYRAATRKPGFRQFADRIAYVAFRGDQNLSTPLVTCDSLQGLLERCRRAFKTLYTLLPDLKQ